MAIRIINKPRPPPLIINGKQNGHQEHTNVNADQQRPAKPIDETYRRIVIVTSVGYVCTLMTIFFLINDEVPKPYMDEIFHIEQARAYCVGNFTQWNPKITTPPGLYLTTLGFLKPFSELYAFGEDDPVRICPTFMLRFINLIFAASNAYVMYLIGLHTLKQNTRPVKVNLLLSTFSLANFPPLFFFTFLFYTDLGSLFFVLLMYLHHINNQEWLASLFGAISLLFRQTNIVWMFFLASYSSLKIVTKYTEKSRRAKIDQIIKATSLPIIKTCGGYAIFGVAFVLFVIYNKGIVVGDRSAHEAAFHLPQLFYYLGFISFFSFTWIYTFTNIVDFLAYAAKRYVRVLLVGAVMAVIVSRLTYVHPYLLADNRHYTFYIWRRVFGRSDYLPLACIPIYIFTAFAVNNTLRGKDNLWKCLYALCVFISLVPQQLFEFRYFLTPYILWRLNITSNASTYQLVIEFLLNIIVNGLTFYMFIYKPFKWSNSHDWQRFMW